MKNLAHFTLFILALVSIIFSPEFATLGFALAIYAGPDCSDCEGNDQGEVEFTDCPNLFESEICDVYMVDSENGQPKVKPTDWTNPAEWAQHLSQSDPGKIRKLTGIGNLPAPEQETVTISKRRKAFGMRTYTLTHEIDEFNLMNYEWARELQCGGTKHIWPATIGGFMYGGENGIKVTVIPPNMPLESGENVYKKIQIQFEWTAKYDPPIIANPLADNGNGGS